MYLKLSYFHYQNLILLSEKNYKKQAQMFYQNHSLTLYTTEIFCNSILRKIIGLGLEKSQTTLLVVLGSD